MMQSKQQKLALIFTCILYLQLSACEKENQTELINKQSETENIDPVRIKITIGTSSFSATLENNSTASAFSEDLPVTLTMNELNNNEKYFDLPESLPKNAFKPGTIKNGDLMLFGSNTLVLFYKTFSTSYNYTKIGEISNPKNLSEALGSGAVEVTFELLND